MLHPIHLGDLPRPARTRGGYGSNRARHLAECRVVTDVIGERPRPWVLVYGIADDDELKDELQSHFETVRLVGDDYEFGSLVRQSDYDLLVVRGQVPFEPESNLNVLQFGGDFTGEVRPGRSHQDGRRVLAREIGAAERLVGPDEGAPPEVDELARGSLSAWLLQQPIHCLLGLYRPNNTLMGIDPGVVAFVRETGRAACAGLWKRPGKSNTEWWWLPDGCPREIEWVTAASRHLSAVDPVAFPPADADWATHERWMTGREASAVRAPQSAREELRRVVEEQESQVSDKNDLLVEARSEAADGARRLLTHQGDDLKAAVQNALETFGFKVEDSDDKRKRDAKSLLEDLQVRNDGWCAIVEVRGYAKSEGKTHDLLRLGRAAAIFTKVIGEPPAARWYVVNQSFSRSPDSRPLVMQGAEEDVAEFAESSGLVIDTRDIFQLLRDVETGTRSRDEVRAILMATTGRLELPEKVGGEEVADA